MPNMVIACPKDSIELEQMMDFSLDYFGPLSIRYPKGNIRLEHSIHTPIELGKWEKLTNNNSDIVVLATGAVCVSVACNANITLSKEGKKIDVINARFIKPLDEELLMDIKDKTIITIEDNVISGSFGSAVAEYYVKNNIKANLHILGIDDKILKTASQEELLADNGINCEHLINYIKQL